MSKNNDEPIYTGGMLPEMVISSDKNTGQIRQNNVPHIAVKKSKLRKNAGEQYFHKGMKRFWEESPVSAPTLILGLATLPFGASILNAGKTFVTDVTTMGKPFYRKLAGDVLAGTAASTAINEINKAITGKDWNTAVRESLPEGPKWIPNEVKEFAADATNPGWYVGSNLLTKGFNIVSNNTLTKPIGNILKKGRNQIAKTIVSENLRSNLNKTKIPNPIQNGKVIQFQSNPNYEVLYPSDIKFKQLTGQLLPKRKSQLSLAERLGVPKAERNLIYSHPGEGTATMAPENIYLINRSNESIHNFSKGKLVWKYPITYQGDSYRRFTNHWSFIEPVKSHMGGGWDTAPTTMLYPYKQAVYDNGFPANINIMDTYWANPQYFTLQGDKVRILTSDINQYNILKKQGVNVEFSKEGADLLKQIKQTSDQNKIQELATLHDKIHRNWTLKYTKDVDPNMYNKLAEEVDKAKLNYDGRPTSKIIEPDGSFHSAPPAHNHSLYGRDNNVVWHIGRNVPISKEEIPVLQRMVREGDLQVPTFESFKQNLRQIHKRDRNYYIRMRDLSERPPYSHPNKDAINNAIEFIRFRESLSTYPKVIQKVFKKKQGGKIDFNVR